MRTGPDLAFHAWVPRVSGIVEKLELPQLTISEAISRGWEKLGPLYLPKGEEFLKTYPMPWISSVDPEKPWGEPPKVDLTYLRPLGGPGYWPSIWDVLREIRP